MRSPTTTSPEAARTGALSLDASLLRYHGLLTLSALPFSRTLSQLDVLERIEQLLCINTSSVWASGCSNGGQFLFELASDTRIAGQIAGIFPAVGLPHNGFNKPPASPMHIFGMWGSNDIIVPPLSNTDDPGKSYDTQNNGWCVDAFVNPIA